MTIDRLIDNMRAVNVRELVEDAMHANTAVLVRLQREQMLTGYRADGKRIGRYKSAAYRAKKAAQNPLAGGFVDLRLEGYFQGDIFVDVRDNSVVFDSADTKAGKLIEKYGEDIFGLRRQVIGDFVKVYLRPKGIELLKQKIFK